MNTKLLRIIALSTMLLIVFANVDAQKKKKGKDADKEEKSDEPKKIADEIKGANKIDGLFTLYQDTVSGSVDLEIRQDQINKEYIHFYYVENGALEASAFRGQFRGSRIIKIEKYFNRIEFSVQNTTSYFDPDEAISKAADANMSGSIVFSGEIKAGSQEEGAYLIEADKLFLTEALGMVKFPPPVKPDPAAFNLGKLSDAKTKYSAIKNYPENTDIIVDYVYENGAPKNFGSRAVVDARNVTIKVQHSLIAVPENDYQPRIDDPRVGYFTSQVTDMTSKSSTPYRDLVHRWNLIKKDPGSELSEPVEPITWWIENTTPKEIRPIIKKAGESWNIAFEKAGFINAVVLKEQPDDATWDAGDIRYNVLRWTASPNLAFGGYGPSFVNPRTGQILGADVMLEYAVLGYRLRNDRVFATEGFLDFEAEELENEPWSGSPYCQAGLYGQINNIFGMTAVSVLDEDTDQKSKLLEEYLMRLILHEIGHTLGLNHNMMASQLHGLTDIHNEAITKEKGLTGSVMDYPSINFALNREAQGQYYDVKPGPYDNWAIEFGYKPVDSQDELDKLLSRSTEPNLQFGNDADDMRSPGRAIDPRINVGDMSSNAVDYAIERIKLSKEVLSELLAKYKKDNNTSYDEFQLAYLIVTSQHFQSANTISRYIGGLYLDRAFIGQPGATKPYIPVEKDKQIKAMKALSDYIFAPNSFNFNGELYNYLQRQRRGFNHWGVPEDPRIHSRYLNLQKAVLNHLLHSNVMNRIIDTQLYGNEYKLSIMMTDLNNAIFKADARSSVNSFRQNLQVEYVNMLIKIVNKDKENYLSGARSMALFNLKSARAIASGNYGDTATKAHRQHLLFLIDKAFKAD